MAQTNNVNLEGINAFTEQLQHDPSKARKTQVIEGEWILGGGGPQFKSVMNYEGGKTILETDNPTFMGGRGTMPGPMHYCFFGLISCYTGIFATTASAMGIKLKSLKTKVEADVNFSRVFGQGSDPIMEEIRVTLQVESDASESEIRVAESVALERCPVVFTLRNIVKLTPAIEILPH